MGGDYMSNKKRFWWRAGRPRRPPNRWTLRPRSGQARETPVAPSHDSVLARDRLSRRCHWQQQWHFGNDDPSEHIRDDARNDSTRECDEEPQYPHQRYVEIQILRQPRTNAPDLSVGARAHQFFRCGRNPHHDAAVGTKAAVLGDGLAASVAVHVVS